MNTCQACEGQLPKKAAFCPWCGFRLKPIGTAEHIVVSEEPRPLTAENPVLLTTIKRAEGRASTRWLKKFNEPEKKNGATAGKVRHEPRLEVVDPPPPPRSSAKPSRAQPSPRGGGFGRGVTSVTEPEVIDLLQVKKKPPAAETLYSRSKEANEPGARKFSRHPVKVEVGYATEHNFFTGFMENLSSGGLFVATHAPAEIDDVLEIAFSVPGLGRATVAMCQVQWVRDYSPDLPDMIPGMGLRFIELTSEARAAVELFIRHREPIFFTD